MKIALLSDTPGALDGPIAALVAQRDHVNLLHRFPPASGRTDGSAR